MPRTCQSPGFVFGSRYMERMTAIVPAFNEASTIGRFIDVLRRSPLIGEVIVVSDGSTDHTADVARRHGARVLTLPVNVGKGFAVHYGARHAASSYVALFDADLRHLRERHVRQLLGPVIRGQADVSVGLIDRGPFVMALSAYLPLLSGQRVLRRSLLLSLPLDIVEGYKIEAALNYVCDLHGARVKTVVLDGLTLRRKHEKIGIIRGAVAYITMGWDVLLSIVLVRFIYRTRTLTAS